MIDIPHSGETRWDPEVLVKASNSAYSPLKVLGVPGDTPRIEVRFQNLGTMDIGSGPRVEPSLIVELELLVGDGVAGAGVATLFSDEPEGFWSNAGARRG